jgi:ubiquinone biosynthesis UbiH/UbiF/VisC/COQ6 family hydroxylase
MEFDVIVVGGGPVGLALARALRGARVAVVSRDAPPPAPGGDGAFDARVYAVSPGNAAFLRELKAWQALPSERVTPVVGMRVFGDRRGAQIEFDAYRAGVPELAWTVEDRALNAALAQAALGADGLEVFSAGVTGIEIAADAARVSLGDGRELRARLVAGADGARSAVRAAAGIAARESDYGQVAVVANFRCSKPHEGTALQWFQGGPVLALLPLPGERVSMVWSLPAQDAQRIASLPPDALCREVERASQGLLGAFELETPARAYPLRRLAAARLSAPRVALAGDAAHVIHPLAGQGLNLGLQDARVLAQVLAGREPGRDPGDPALLRRYERRRAEPILAMDGAVDGLFRLFGAAGEPAAWLRNAGLNLTGGLPVLKNLLIRHAMG